jgi:predicted transcriptional regulator YdeE
MPDYRIVVRPGFTVVGLALRTSNSQPDQIGGLWQEFYTRNIASLIRNAKSGDIYSVYIDYEGDHTQPYTLVIGCEADAINVPPGLVAKNVPAARYAVFPASGKQPESVIAAWQKVWGADLSRTYSGDFDLYSAPAEVSPQQQQVEIYVAVR